MMKYKGWIESLLVLMSCSILADTPQVLEYGKEDDGKLLEQIPYEFPKSYDAWLDKAKTTPRTKERSRWFPELYSEALFDRCRSGKKAKVSRITYMSSGLRINGYLVKPLHRQGPAPVIIFNHGGVAQWGDITLHEILEMCRMAERGYLLLASHFRGEGGSEGKPDMGGGDVIDSFNLVELAKGLAGADTQRIGVWGFSRGGGVTYRALSQSDIFAAAVIIGGPTDALTSSRREEFDKYVYPHVLRNYEKDKDAALLSLSPVRWAEKLSATTPLLMLHGGADWRVSSEDSLRMAIALRRLERVYRLKIYEGSKHSLLDSYSDVRREMDRWFDLYLRDGVKLSNAAPVMPSSLKQKLKQKKETR